MVSGYRERVFVALISPLDRSVKVAKDTNREDHHAAIRKKYYDARDVSSQILKDPERGRGEREKYHHRYHRAHVSACLAQA